LLVDLKLRVTSTIKLDNLRVYKCSACLYTAHT
jgi:hypothetical protein